MKYYRSTKKATKFKNYPIRMFERLEVDGIKMRIAIFNKLSLTRQTLVDKSKYFVYNQGDWPIVVTDISESKLWEEVDV